MKIFIPLFFSAIGCLAVSAAELKLQPEPVRSVPAEIPQFEGMDEELFKHADAVVLLPVSGQHAPEAETRIRMVRTPGFLYLLFDCDELDMTRIPVRYLPHDSPGIADGDAVEFLFVPPESGKVRRIVLDASGNLFDSENGDPAWESRGAVKRERDEEGFRLELILPLDVLGKVPPEQLPANFIRRRRGAPDVRIAGYQWAPPGTKNWISPGEFSVLQLRNVPENLIENGDFSQSAGGRVRDWNGKVPGGSWLWQNNGDFIRGGKSLQLSVDSRRNRQGMVQTQKLPGLKPGTRYRLSFFVNVQNVAPLPKTKGGGAVVVKAGKWRFRTEWFTGNMPWTLKSFEFTTPEQFSEDDRPEIRLELLSAGGTIRFDDLRLTPVPGR